MKKILKLEEIRELLGAEVLQEQMAAEGITGAYCSDLLSDVMAHAGEGEALITIQAHKNSVAVAGLYGAPCIVICNSRPVPEDMIRAAADEKIALLRCGLNQYRVSGLIFSRFQAAANS